MPNDYILRSDAEKMLLNKIGDFLGIHTPIAGALAEGIIIVLKELLSELSSIQSADRWIPVSERLPENGEQVFCCFRWGGILDRQVLIYEDGVFYDGAEKFGFPVTYWMPLPPNPSSHEK